MSKNLEIENLKAISLHNELYTAIKLIEIGIREYQCLNYGNDFYYVPFQLLSSGFERFMKCYIFLGFIKKEKRYPIYEELKSHGGKGGHDLISLKNNILEQFYQNNGRSALKDDFRFLRDDQFLEKIIKLLSEFGKFSRYYNLNVMTNSEKLGIDVVDGWKKMEFMILTNDRRFSKFFEYVKNPNPGNIEKRRELESKLRNKIIKYFERFTRALSRQFTLGFLSDIGKEFSGVLNQFLFLTDDELGTKQY